MTTRRYYLISYDIASNKPDDKASDKRRNKIFESLLARGDHVQFSVFLCELNPREHAELQATLIDTIDHKKDQVLFVDLGHATNPLDKSIEILGKTLQLPSRVLVV